MPYTAWVESPSKYFSVFLLGWSSILNKTYGLAVSCLQRRHQLQRPQQPVIHVCVEDERVLSFSSGEYAGHAVRLVASPFRSEKEIIILQITDD